MLESAVLQKSPKILTRAAKNRIILFPLQAIPGEKNNICALNESAAYVWQLIDGRRTLGDIKKAILKEFDVTGKELDKGLEKILKELRKIKAIR